MHEVLVNKIVDLDRAEIGILAVEATFRRLVGMLEPVVTDKRRLSQCPSDVTPEGGGTLGLGSDQRSGAVGVRQPGIGAAKREFADQAGLPVATYESITGLASES